MHSIVRQSYGGFWGKLGNEWRTGRVSPTALYTFLRQRPSLHHIEVDKIVIVDHLGRNIPVPTKFCSTWEVTLLRR